MANIKDVYHNVCDNLIKTGPIYIMTTIWLFVGNFLGLYLVYWFSDLKIIDFGQVIIWALAIFLLGGLIGLIFGVPKSVASPGNESTALGEQTPGMKKVIKTSTTNLTEISDWLTKVVIGAGLVQLKQIPGYIWKVAQKMADGMVAARHPSPVGLCAAIIIYYFCFGLLCGYFIMRTIFNQLFNESA